MVLNDSVARGDHVELLFPKIGQILADLGQKYKIFKIALSDLWNYIHGGYMPNFKSLACTYGVQMNGT